MVSGSRTQRRIVTSLAAAALAHRRLAAGRRAGRRRDDRHHRRQGLPGVGTRIEGATVLLADGKIAAVGRGVAVPAGARVIDAAGKVVTPGLFDSVSQIGSGRVSTPTTTTTEARERTTASPPPSTSPTPSTALGSWWRVTGSRGSRAPWWCHAPGRRRSPARRRCSISPAEARARSPWHGRARPVAMVVQLGRKAPSSPAAPVARRCCELREALEDARDFAAHRDAWERGAATDLRPVAPRPRGAGAGGARRAAAGGRRRPRQRHRGGAALRRRLQAAAGGRGRRRGVDGGAGAGGGRRAGGARPDGQPPRPSRAWARPWRTPPACNAPASTSPSRLVRRPQLARPAPRRRQGGGLRDALGGGAARAHPRRRPQSGGSPTVTAPSRWARTATWWCGAATLSSCSSAPSTSSSRGVRCPPTPASASCSSATARWGRSCCRPPTGRSRAAWRRWRPRARRDRAAVVTGRRSCPPHPPSRRARCGPV